MNNNTQTIKCPNCQTRIPLNSALKGEIEEHLRSKIQKQNQAKEEEYQKKLDLLNKQNDALKQKEEKVDEEVKKKMQKEREELEKYKAVLEEEKEKSNLELKKKLEEESEKLKKKAKDEAKKDLNLELEDLKNKNQEQAKKMYEFEKNELNLRKKQRELEEEKKNMALEVERKLEKERQKLFSQAKEELSMENQKSLREKDHQMAQMRRTIEDLKRKSEQGSMQVQGDAQEEELKELLQRSFPSDKIEDVPTGIKGADLIQTVMTKFGEQSGVILIESKNTKAWSNSWVKKLKDDQGNAKADVCILISRILPDEIKTFGTIEGVFVCNFQFFLPLVKILRQKLSEVSAIKEANVGKNEKLESLYSYLSGSQFKNRIENIVNAFESMKQELEKEKRAMTRIWSKREKEIERVVLNTSGMYGDLEGIMGNQSLPEVKSLMLEEGEDES